MNGLRMNRMHCLTKIGMNAIARRHASSSHQVVVLGGGTGGCAMASRLCKLLGPGKVAVIEPSDTHYYQPLFTLVGAGLKKMSQTRKPMRDVLPSASVWIKDGVEAIHAADNRVVTKSGQEINYDYLVIAMGLEPKLDKIVGLEEALKSNPNVVTNYMPEYTNKTFKAMESFDGGNAIFTFPAGPVKCPGAPQKIMYLFDDYMRRHGKREKANIIFNSNLPVIFGVKHYADALWEVVKKRGLEVNLQTNLVEILSDSNEAVFSKVAEEGKKVTCKFDFMHVSPPLGTPDALLTANGSLVNTDGLVTVNKETFQHSVLSNVFALGDCSSAPTSKTAAAISSQSHVLVQTIDAVMQGKTPPAKYDGYTSCPLVTSDRTCILAEFDYSLMPLETFPVNQSKERRSMYRLKADILPEVYWRMLLKGKWNGPTLMRKALHLGLKS